MSDGLIHLLRQTLDPVQSRHAEQGLTNAEREAGFVRSLLQVVCEPHIELSIRQAGALFFKNFIKRNWSVDNASNIPEQDKEYVKAGIVVAMTNLPPSLQLQIGESITLIANTDFPKLWPGLINDLIDNISETNMTVTNGVLQTAHSIFKRWRAQYRSDELFTEIAFVLEKFCQPFLITFKQVDRLIEDNRENVEALKILFESMILLTKVFYDLNSQDIPEFFEDHMPEFMSIFHKYMNYSNASIEAIAEDDIASPVDRTKASICEVAELYTQRYEEVFPMLPEFVNSAWTLLTQVSDHLRFDLLVGRALSFLTCVVKIQRHAALFQSESVLQQFVEKIVLPNMALRPSDEELFEDDPIEYIRRDLEGGDNDTRRRAATDFVRGLVEQFEQQVTSIVMRYAGHYLKLYEAEPLSAWTAKDTAIYLITSVAIKGVITRHGVSSTNLTIDIVQIYKDNLLPDLQSPFQSCHPILKLDAIKFVLVFRNQLSKEQLTEAFPLIANHLRHENSVVSTYAAITIEALLSLKTDEGNVVDKHNIGSIAEILTTNLFQLVESGKTPEKLAENDFLMRCIMRVIISAQDSIAALGVTIVGHLNHILAEISKNPSNPRFNHYLFECYGAVFRYARVTSTNALTEIESLTLGPLLALLQNDVAEFVPYAFQLLAQSIELRGDAGLPSAYLTLLQPLLTPALWDSRGNIPALVRLIQAFLCNRESSVQAQASLEPILGIFQKLISSKVNDHYGFDLIETIYTSLPAAALAQYNQQIFVLLLTRLNNSNTEKFTLRYIVFIFYLSALTRNAGPDFVIKTLDTIQLGIFSQVYSNVILPNAQKIIAPSDTRTTSLGLTNILTESQQMRSEYMETLWLGTLTCQLKFLELPAQLRQEEDSMALESEEIGFQSTFVKLRTAQRSPVDPFAQIADPKAYFVENLAEMIRTDNNCHKELSKLPVDGQTTLRAYGLPL